VDDTLAKDFGSNHFRGLDINQKMPVQENSKESQQKRLTMEKDL